MCLTKKHPGFKRAKKDIKVYKVLKLKTETPEIYSGPYYDFNYEIRNEYHTELVERLNHARIPEFEVTCGFHAYIDSNDVIEDFKIFRWWYKSEVLFECVIPEGSLYAISRDGRQIVSNKIRIIQKVFDEMYEK